MLPVIRKKPLSVCASVTTSASPVDHSLQSESASDRCVIAAPCPGVSAIAVRPMRTTVQNAVDSWIAWVAFCLPSPHESIVNQIAFETTSWRLVETGSMRIHVTQDDCRLIVDAEFSPFLQKGLRNPPMRPPIPCFPMVVRQMRVEEIDAATAEPELPPGDGPFSIFIPLDAHPIIPHK